MGRRSPGSGEVFWGVYRGGLYAGGDTLFVGRVTSQLTGWIAAGPLSNQQIMASRCGRIAFGCDRNQPIKKKTGKMALFTYNYHLYYLLLFIIFIYFNFFLKKGIGLGIGFSCKQLKRWPLVNPQSWQQRVHVLTFVGGSLALLGPNLSSKYVNTSRSQIL